MLDRSPQRAGFFFVVACFSCYVAVASFFGAFFPAVALAHYNAPIHWQTFLIVLTNGMFAGAFIGGVCGMFSVIGYRIFGVGDPRTSSDRALDLLQTPLFVFGAANGVLMAILTATRFQGEWIWLWWRASS